MTREEIKKAINDCIAENQGIQFNPTAHDVFSHLAKGNDPVQICLALAKHTALVEQAHFRLMESLVNIRGIEDYISDPDMKSFFVKNIYKSFKDGN